MQNDDDEARRDELNAASHRCLRELGAAAASHFSSGLTHRCRSVHPQRWQENLDYSGSAW